MTTDRTIDTLGLPHHAPPRDLAKELRHFAQLCDQDLTRAIRYSTLLAARGWPTTTLGDTTGIRSTDPTSSTERAAGTNQPTTPANIRQPRYANADRDLATYLAVIEQAITQVTKLTTDILAHADDIDDIPAGTGNCECCSRFCRPGETGTIDDRLRAGLCPACWKDWTRQARPERGTWIITRRTRLRDALTHGQTPHDILLEDT